MFKSWFGLKNILHYYGDSVRQLFVLSALIFVVVVPLWGDLLPFGAQGALLQIAIAIGLVILAGFTSPRSMLSIVLDLFAAGIGAFLLEAAAISFYRTDSWLLFFARELVAVMLLFALYFSVKTLRAMLVGSIGGDRDVVKKDERKNI